MADKKCVKKILGDVMKISDATPEQLRKIEKCTILAAGGTPNPKVYGKSKRGYKQTDTLKLRNIQKKK